MDDFLFAYLFMLVVGGVLFIAFWGAVIYVGFRLFGGSSLSADAGHGCARGDRSQSLIASDGRPTRHQFAQRAGSLSRTRSSAARNATCGFSPCASAR